MRRWLARDLNFARPARFPPTAPEGTQALLASECPLCRDGGLNTRERITRHRFTSLAHTLLLAQQLAASNTADRPSNNSWPSSPATPALRLPSTAKPCPLPHPLLHCTAPQNHDTALAPPSAPPTQTLSTAECCSTCRDTKHKAQPARRLPGQRTLPRTWHTTPTSIQPPTRLRVTSGAWVPRPQRTAPSTGHSSQP